MDDSQAAKKLSLFNKFLIPPNFELARYHQRSCKLYKINPQQTILPIQHPPCPCCNRRGGYEKIGICSNSEDLKSIGEQVPLFLVLRNFLLLIATTALFLKVGEFVFFSQGDCKTVKYVFDDSYPYQFQLLLGFYNFNSKDDKYDKYFMIQCIVYTVLIFLIKLSLKQRKYISKKSSNRIQSRSVELVNLDKKATINDIIHLFEGFLVDQVTFTYNIAQYHSSMAKMHKMEKKLLTLNQKISSKPSQQKSEILAIHSELMSEVWELEDLKSTLITNQNRTSIAYVVLNSKIERDKVIKKFKCNRVTKVFYKMFPRCSSSVIGKKHITITEAPSPDSIIWQNLGSPYLTIKIIRVVSFFFCCTILLFGMVTEIVIVNILEGDDLVNKILSTGTIFIVNFFIINFLEWITKNVQKRTSLTNIKLSLIRKITFFLFVNVSITPYIVFILEHTDSPEQILADVGFQILLIGLSNCFKPLLTLFSVERVKKWIKCKWEQSKGKDCQLNQIEANELFEPLDFPIQIYYSLVHTSLMTMFFYLSFYQILVVIELLAIFLLYFVAKWMLVRVCKKPSGISLKLNNLAQSLLRTYLLLFWLGFYPTHYLIKEPKSSQTIQGFVQFAILKNLYTTVSICCVMFLLLCEPLISYIALVIQMRRDAGEISEGFMGENLRNQRTYKQANMGFTINGQNYNQMKSRLKIMDIKMLQRIRK